MIFLLTSVYIVFARENPTANLSLRMLLHLGISPLHFHPRIGHLVISLKKRRDRRILHPFQVPRLGSDQYSSGYMVFMKIFLSSKLAFWCQRVIHIWDLPLFYKHNVVPCFLFCCLSRLLFQAFFLDISKKTQAEKKLKQISKNSSKLFKNSIICQLKTYFLLKKVLNHKNLKFVY